MIELKYNKKVPFYYYIYIYVCGGGGKSPNWYNGPWTLFGDIDTPKEE